MYRKVKGINMYRMKSVNWYVDDRTVRVFSRIVVTGQSKIYKF